jgi:hypothetical protein
MFDEQLKNVDGFEDANCLFYFANQKLLKISKLLRGQLLPRVPQYPINFL